MTLPTRALAGRQVISSEGNGVKYRILAQEPPANRGAADQFAANVLPIVRYAIA